MLIESRSQREALLKVVMFGHIHFQSLWAGVELGFFEALSKGELTLDELAAMKGLARQPAKMVLANLCALGLVEHHGDKYANDAVANELLVESSPNNVVNILRWQADIVYPGIEDYVRSLRENTNSGLERFSGEGRTLYERIAHDKRLEKVFQDAMADMPSNRFVATSHNFGRFKHICDCGGGAGRNAMALARQYPSLKVTIFDQPTICERARENVRANGLADRISTHAGNFLADPFPSGIDAVLYSHIASIWSAETNVGVFKRALEALPRGGAFAIYNMVANNEHTGPLEVTCGSVYFHALATGEGFMHSAREYEEMLRAAGFSSVETFGGLPVSHALIIGTK